MRNNASISMIVSVLTACFIFYSCQKRIMRCLLLALFVVILYVSCKKEKSCEGCINGNIPPIAKAGPDQSITLPTDSILLDGSASNDPDGLINSFLWTKISGPVSIAINNAANAKAVVKNLASGTYEFELRVTDNKGLSAKDTMQLNVTDPTQSNRPPVANAGPDQTITLPANTITLDGSASTDPDNNITSYTWTKISGPSSFTITNANAKQTQVTIYIPGTNQIELKVTDAGGLFSRDTIIFTVNPFVYLPPPLCDNSDRPKVNVKLIPFPIPSQARVNIMVASGREILFAGTECPDYDNCKLRVDIYDTLTQLWSNVILNDGRWDMAAIAARNKIFFAGGRMGDGAFDQLYSRVDIYDIATSSWSVAQLSEPRAYLTAAAVGNKVFFAGGEKDWNYNTSATVDIYDLLTNTWSLALLSQPRSYISATTLNNSIYFAGGHREDRWYMDPSDRIEIYDNNTNVWSTSSLLVHKGTVNSVAFNDKIYWSGQCPVEIRNTNTGISSIQHLSRSGGGYSVLLKDNILFFSAGNKFDIYDTQTNTWSIGVLPQSLQISSVISFNNTVYISTWDKVWKLEF